MGSYCLARLGNAELAEEMTSRVFLIVVRQYGQLRGSAVGWLWSIVRSEIAGHFRSRRSYGELTDVASPSTSADAQFEAQETQRRLTAALSRIGENEQQILFMKYFQDLQHKEIAEALGTTQSNVGVIVFRALKTLRHLMEDNSTIEAEVKLGKSRTFSDRMQELERERLAR